MAEDQEILALKSTMEQTLTDDVLMNIYGEAVDISPRFENVCLYDGHSHPKTYRLTQTVSQIGWYVVQHNKEKFKRTRPSIVAPHLIRPLIKVPSHPAYPSGHAIQSKLIGMILIEVMGSNTSDLLKDRIEEVYLDIGENRERAGVHYPSDTAAGQKLAYDVFQLIGDDTKLLAAIEAAKEEWT
jgi:acid phosphatase (class A)